MLFCMTAAEENNARGVFNLTRQPYKIMVAVVVLYAPRGHDGATRPASEFVRPKGNCGKRMHFEPKSLYLYVG